MECVSCIHAVIKGQDRRGLSWCLLLLRQGRIRDFTHVGHTVGGFSDVHDTQACVS